MLQSLRSLLAGDPAHDIVWTADISYWIAGRRYAGVADPAWDTEQGYLALCRDLGILPYYWYDKFWLGHPVYDDVVTVLIEANGRDTTTRRWRTPLGDLREETTFLPQSCSVGVTRYPVQTEADLRALDSLAYALRRTLEAEGLAGCILTIRNRGYAFAGFPRG